MSKAYRLLAAELGRDECLLLIGLGLVAYGLSLVSTSAAFVVPGGVILWVAMPSRSPFVSRHAPATKKEPV
jgi:hypothetical protein